MESPDQTIRDVKQSGLVILEKIQSLKTFLLRKEGDLGDAEIENGISFLTMKSQVLLEYEACLLHFLMLKSENKSTRDHPVINRLVSLRVVLDKIRPIEKKLQYQIDKTIRAAKHQEYSSSMEEAEDPLSFKPHVDELTTAELNASSAVMDLDDEKEGVYVPPKQRMVMFEEEQDVEKRNKKREHKLKKKLDSSAIVQYVREEFTDTPQEYKSYGTDETTGPTRMEEEQREFEEDNFMRVTLTKADKKLIAQKGRSKRDRIDAFEDFDDFSDLVHLSKKVTTSEKPAFVEKSFHKVKRNKRKGNK